MATQEEQQGFPGYQQQSERKSTCVGNCGFFGSPATLNMCSKCYREHVLKASQNLASACTPQASTPQQAGAASPCSLLELSHGRASVPGSGASPLASAGVGAGGAAEAQSQPSKNRCLVCKKKVGLTGFKCRCDGLFCSLHRYSDKHECSFDYKAAGREAIAKASPVIKADKIERF
eukprot:TRINITY_DN25679_c0_g1_i1.p1 TRINITY_DN25679_c0_g1~~TRINITY_DN25679_c0_g1_i1.p1  ORF type:complete len:176 (-),score=3.00 TRINITY_DN25679_c0_g1_i1:214-741(-)